MDISKLKEIAINEVLNPTFELTKQYLQANELYFFNSTPQIDDVEIDREANTAAVYFPIKKENFYFVIYIENLEVNWMGMSAGNGVCLFACSEVLSAEELVGYLGFEPTERWNINDKTKFGGKRKKSGIIYQPIEKKTGEVEDKLTNLLNRLLPYKEEISKLSDVASVEIQVTYYGYKDEMWGFHFDKKIIKKLSDLGLDIDIDLYAGGNDLE